jgi:hypothetical protein
MGQSVPASHFSLRLPMALRVPAAALQNAKRTRKIFDTKRHPAGERREH